MSKVLITGGAGFIGSHLADRLLQQGHSVRILDSLVPQVHGAGQKRPAYLTTQAELIVGDIRDEEAVDSALDDIEVVYHLASLVGVGQSMYAPYDYVSVNSAGTARLLEALQRRPVRRLVVASSMSIYGEGSYETSDGQSVQARERTVNALREHQWDPTDAAGNRLRPKPTPESKPPTLASVYALSKYDQERLCLMFGQAYGMPTVALRFFNVYGTRQALSNPYTGVMAIFASRLLNGKPPLVFEDGQQLRDFVSVHDIAEACALAMTSELAVGRAINVGSGQPRTVCQVAEAMADALGRRHIKPELNGRARTGDIRHCFADIRSARQVLGFEPHVTFERGVAELVGWLRGQQPRDLTEEAQQELAQRGLSY